MGVEEGGSDAFIAKTIHVLRPESFSFIQEIYH